MMGSGPPFPMPPARRPERTMWRCQCDGCGAPLQRNDLQCSYCLRATMTVAEGAVYTQQQNYSLKRDDLGRITGVVLTAGVVTPDEARQIRRAWPGPK